MEPNINPITPRPPAGGDFGGAFFSHLQGTEGRVERIYTDSKGIPHLGVGTALAVRGTDDKFHLHQDLDKRISQATDGRHQLTPDERQRLQDTVNAINAGDSKKAKKLIPPNDPNEERKPGLKQANNKFGFTVDEAGMRRAAQGDMEKARQSAWNDVEKEAKKAGWSDSQIADYKSKFENSKEMIGLASIKYNTGPGEKLPETNKAIVNGDRARAVYEIEFRTNLDKDEGIANRRIDEAGFFSDGMTDADRERLQQIAKENESTVDDYAKRFPDAFGRSAAVAGMFRSGDPDFGDNGPTGQDDGADDDSLPGNSPPSNAPDFGNNGPTGQDDGADDDTSGGGDAQKQSANVTDPEAPSRTQELRPGEEGGEQTLEIKPDPVIAPEKKEMTPEQNLLLKDFDKTDGPLDDILAKDPRDLTNEEFIELKKQVIRLPAGPEQEQLDGVAMEFLRDKFGDGKAKFDAVGRMIDPKPIRPINKSPVPAKTPGGELLQNAISKIGKVVAETAGDEGSANAVQGLQRGLNLLKQVALRGGAKSSPAKRPALGTGLRSILVPDLKTDGIVGPKTRRALKIATSRLGTPRIKEGLALGRFGKFAEDVGTGRDDTRKLAPTIAKSFGSLFRNPRSPRPSSNRPTEENLAFQSTINDLGANAFGRDTFKPIREDGLIGPKTESAFNSILPATGPDRFTSRFGHNLGFFDFDDIA